jgi:hypothetical protein
MFYVIIALVILYVIVWRNLPVIVYVSNGFKIDKVIGKVGVYTLRAAEKVPIPSYNWREVETGVSIAPFGSFTIGKRTFNIFGQVGFHVYSIPEIKMKGVDVLPTIYNDIPREPIKVIMTNTNPKYPYIVKEGDIIAYLELVRLPSFRLIHFH